MVYDQKFLSKISFFILKNIQYSAYKFAPSKEAIKRTVLRI